MAKAIKVTMPELVTIGNGYSLFVSAQDTSGNEVATVKINNMAIEVIAEGLGPLDSGVFAPVLLRQQPTKGG